MAFNKFSVPRLEALAAESLVKLHLIVLPALKDTVDRVLHWTDSTTVLYWLENQS